MSILMTRTRPTGRHRLGRPGLIPVTALVTVVRRGFFAAWFRPARHRSPVAARPAASAAAGLFPPRSDSAEPPHPTVNGPAVSP